MKIINLARELSNLLSKTKFPKYHKNEYAFESKICEVLRKSLATKPDFKGKDLGGVIITHGKNPEEQRRWTESKEKQNVIIAGHHNTFDIVIKLSKKEIIPIEVKYAKDNLTGAIQRMVGQCIIASLSHPAVIGILVSAEKPKDSKKDKLNRLKSSLRINNNI